MEVEEMKIKCQPTGIVQMITTENLFLNEFSRDPKVDYNEDFVSKKS